MLKIPAALRLASSALNCVTTSAVLVASATGDAGVKVPAAPVSPLGITKSNTAASLVPVLVTVGLVPAAPAVTVPTVMVAAAPVGPVAPVEPFIYAQH